MAEAYQVEFTERAVAHLAPFPKAARNVILDDIKAQLPYQPNVETRNRKLLRQNPLADWELRVGPYRVFYDIDEVARLVRLVAIGYKEHNELHIEGKKFDL